LPEGWQWDASLFRGTAAYYVKGRLPYPPQLHDAFAAAAELGGSPRLIDVGCGPGNVALLLADLFIEVVGVDPDPDMLLEAARTATEHGVPNARWVCLRAEELPAGLGRFRHATFAQSFYWMERDLVARTIFDMLEPGGAFVHVDTSGEDTPENAEPLPRPSPPLAAIEQLVQRYLGPVRRAGQGYLRHGTPGNERAVLEAAGFETPTAVRVAGRQVFERTIEDVVADVFSASGSAPHLFGDRVGEFER
jgi:SAM-dependent methyltransferase